MRGAAAPPADVGVGSRLGKYEIIKRLATGGMAEIFLARVSGLPGFQKMVVIKRILPQLATKTDFVEMFLDEARIAATLQHPNVVQMYDVGVVDGNYFIAMEYLHGEDVRSIVKALRDKEQRLPVEHALNVVIGVASGLHYAHEKVGFDGKPLEIVHRDVTPQNIIVTYDGAVKLLDFGIAKASNRFGETRFGTLKGKVPYMSPEQCRGEPLDRRSDIFSLGIMLYELTLGRRLYKGKSDFEVLKQIVEGTVTPPRELDAAYPAELEQIVMRALDKEKDKRYQTAREMQADLEALVRADRMHVSPIALTRFMEEVFGQKIEAWREAQAQGLSLGDHLQAIAVEDKAPDEEDLDQEALREAERIKAERAAFRQVIERASGVRQAPAELVTRAERLTDALAPARNRRPLVMLVGGALAVAAIGVVLVVHGRTRHKAPVVHATAVAPPAHAPAPAPMPTPTTTPTTTPTATMAATPEPTLTPTPRPTRHAHYVKRGEETRGASRLPTRAAARPKPAPLAAIQSPDAHKPAPVPAKLQGTGTLLLASSPWCNVRIDGADKGPTPLNLKLPAGRHTVVLSNPEFKINRTLPVLILPDQTTRKRLDFTQ